MIRKIDKKVISLVIRTLIILACIVFIWFAQNNFNDYMIGNLNNIAIFIILAVSYNLINGVTGQFSLEPNGFVAIGAYVTALLLLTQDQKLDQFYLENPASFILSINLGFIPSLLVSGVVAAIIAFCLAFPVFRVRGDYLAIVTLGFGFIITILAINNSQITNGSLGLIGIPKYSNLYWTGGAAILTVVLILNIVRSKFGRAMRAVRDDEDAAMAMGINTFKTKTLAFCTSAFFEGIGGGLLATLLTTVSPESFTFLFTFQLLIIIVLGGLGSTTGAIIGTILVIGGMEWLRFLDEPMSLFGYTAPALPGFRMVVFSALLILVMLFAREGIMGKGEIGDFARRIGNKIYNIIGKIRSFRR